MLILAVNSVYIFNFSNPCQGGPRNSKCCHLFHRDFWYGAVVRCRGISLPRRFLEFVCQPLNTLSFFCFWCSLQMRRSPAAWYTRLCCAIQRSYATSSVVVCCLRLTSHVRHQDWKGWIQSWRRGDDLSHWCPRSLQLDNAPADGNAATKLQGRFNNWSAITRWITFQGTWSQGNPAWIFRAIFKFEKL